MDRRTARERDTIAAMITIFCRGLHGGPRGLCDSCAGLLDYAGQRLDKCLFPGSKPTCAACPVHCYRPEMRARVQEVMRYAGPRMILLHPYLALRHYLDSRARGPFVRRLPGQ
ncbi:MAG TPA: nitrous oxide-stimulated promoter family protein [Candidatus Polarisedimenticolia bacterium]|nr:nitrous oxide-stimulated promoter family protein [Candidatus Polarisedimenticolia bacterium]